MRYILVLPAILPFLSCGAAPSAPPPPSARPASISVAPATAEFVALGDTLRLAGDVLDQNGRILAGVALTWMTGDPAVVTVSRTGLVRATGEGTATVTATAGSATGSATMTVRQEVATVTISAPADTVLRGATLELTAEALDGNGFAVAEAEVTWSSSDTSVATVDEFGLVAAVAVGSAQITATSGNVTGRKRLSVVAPPPPFQGTIFIAPDIITPADHTTFEGMAYAGRGSRLVYDRRHGWITIEAFLFDARYSDVDAAVEVAVNPEFGDSAAALLEAGTYSTTIGRLPKVLRADVETVWIHRGRESFGGGNNNLLIHTGLANYYDSLGILEEALVHEASHTSLDRDHAAHPDWLQAQRDDPTFISTYARDNPSREDIAETFLVYVAVRYRMDRISRGLAETILGAVPNRIAYFDDRMLDMYPIGQSAGGTSPSAEDGGRTAREAGFLFAHPIEGRTSCAQSRAPCRMANFRMTKVER